MKKTIFVNKENNNKEFAHKLIDDLPEGVYHLVLVDAESIRSNNQNDFLWGTVYKAISQVTGYSCDELHDMLRWQFLKTNDDKLKSTTALTKTEFNEYIDKVIDWSKSLGIQHEERA